MTDTAQAGDAVLEWLRTEAALRQARRIASRWRLGGYDGLAENLVADAFMAVWERLRSNPPLVVETPAAYGTQVLKSVVRRAAQGQRAVPARDPNIQPSVGHDAPDHASSGAVDEVRWLDDFRVAIEAAVVPHPWVTACMLSYFTLALDGEFTPEMAPKPKAGATPEQARCWPALWFAGHRELFIDGENVRERNRIRRTRARRIQTVLDAYSAVGQRFADDVGLTNG